MLIPLYDRRPPLAALEQVEPEDAVPSCARCPLGTRRKIATPGMLPCAGEVPWASGGIWYVGEHPGEVEDATGKPFTGETGKYTRALVSRLTRAPALYDNVTRCFPGRDSIDVKHIEACRPFLRATYNEARPSRIIALGGKAVLGLLGRPSPILSVRRGYAFLSDGTPVFLVIHPAAAKRNRLVQRWFEEDLEWALRVPIELLDRPPWDAQTMLVETEADALAAERTLSACGWIAFDCETAGASFDPSFRLLAVACCGHGDESFVWLRSALERPETRAPLARLLSGGPGKVGHNVKFDARAILGGLGVEVKPLAGDTRIWRRLCDSDADGHLKTMQELVGMGGGKEIDEAIKQAILRLHKFARGKALAPAGSLTAEECKDAVTRIASGEGPKRYAYGMIDPITLGAYNARDAVSTRRLGSALLPKMTELGVDVIWRSVLSRALPAYAKVEEWGMAVDHAAVERFDQFLSTKIDEARARLAKHGTFNPDSPKQVADLLFGKLGLTPPKQTKTGRDSTDKEVLEELKHQHAAVDDLLSYRRYGKLRSTYGSVGVMSHVRPDGRIHPDIKLDGTASGRTSCEDPNLQNIPRADTPEGKLARDCFIASPGCVLLECDYNQLELRIAALLSGDPVMKRIFQEGIDVHQRTAELISMVAWGIPPEKVEKKHRSAAKAVNFGLIYGMGDDTLASRIGCKLSEARKIREAVVGQFKRYYQWTQERLAEARRTGYVWTWWAGKPARRRNLWKVLDKDEGPRFVAEHASSNTPIQGTGNEFCVASAAEVVDWILGDRLPGVKLVLSVHDSLILDVAERMVPEVAFQVNRIMTGWDSGDVPLTADAKVGRSWGSMESYDEKKWMSQARTG